MKIDERPTPRTDALEHQHISNGQDVLDAKVLCRILERERAAAVEALRLAADTFLDFERVMDLLQRHTSADV